MEWVLVVENLWDEDEEMEYWERHPNYNLWNFVSIKNFRPTIDIMNGALFISTPKRIIF